MDFTNGTVLMIASVPVSVIGKTGEGRIIVQLPSGMQINFMPAMLTMVVDK